jgi:carbon storage regulator CsrA
MEQIQIGNNIVVTVLAIRGNKVRIGISAPREIRILRSELKEVMPELPLISVDPALRLLG